MTSPNFTIDDPKELLSTKRFDVMFKYMYAKSRKLKWNTKYYRDAYKHHIQVWNNFKEYNNPNKNTYEAFINTFHEILDTVEKEGFKEEVSSVPVLNGSILNGAHRFAACLVHNKPIVCNTGVDGRDGAKDCSFHMLNATVEYGKLNPDHCDRAALEYIDLVKNTYTITLFPAATQHSHLAQQTRNAISKNGDLLYEKAFLLNKNGAVNLMRELYWREEWAESNGRSGYNEKAALCFTSGAPVVSFIAQFKSLEHAMRCKEDIRALYGIGKHAVHINDTYEETLRIAKTVLNKNSLRYLNSVDYRVAEDMKLEGLIKEYSELIKASNQNPENYCISAGAVLARFGVKSCKDLDYIHSNAPVLNTANPDIQSHNDYGVNLYPLPYDDIIHNPDNHFYVHGVKFASLGVVKALKEKRNEPKDKVDIEMIEKLLK